MNRVIALLLSIGAWLRRVGNFLWEMLTTTEAPSIGPIAAARTVESIPAMPALSPLTGDHIDTSPSRSSSETPSTEAPRRSNCPHGPTVEPMTILFMGRSYDVPAGSPLCQECATAYIHANCTVCATCYDLIFPGCQIAKVQDSPDYPYAHAGCYGCIIDFAGVWGNGKLTSWDTLMPDLLSDSRTTSESITSPAPAQAAE
jgi:hypothetical protein